MSDWNLQNISGNDANALNGVPMNFNPPPIANNDVLVYSATTQSFVATNVASAGGLTNAVSVGTVSPIFGLNAGTLELRGITGGTNINSTLINTGNQIEIDLKPDININSVTCVDATISGEVKDKLIVQSTVSNQPSLLVSSCHPSVGSVSVLASGDFSTGKGFALIYDYGSENTQLAAIGNPVNPSGNLTINCEQQTTVNGTTQLNLSTVGDIVITSTNLTSNFTNGTYANKFKTGEFLDQDDNSGANDQYLGTDGGTPKWKKVDINDLSGIVITSPTDGQLLQYQTPNFVNWTPNFSSYTNTQALVSFGTITAQKNSFYFIDGNYTINIPSETVPGTRYGFRRGSNGVAINFNNAVYVNDDVYIGSCGVTGGDDGNILEVIFINNNFQTNWLVINQHGNWNFNGNLTKPIKSINDIENVSIVSPTNGDLLEYNSSTQKWENNPSSSPVTIYTGDAIILGNRIVDMGTYNLRWDDGVMIFNIDNIKNNSSTAQNFIVTSDSNGLLKSYNLTQTKNSVSFNVDVQNMTNTDNILNLYQYDSTGNAAFNMKIYFSLQGFVNSSSYCWDLTNYISGTDTGWGNIPCSQANSNGNSYILQGRIGQFSGNQIQLRLVRITDNTFNPGVAGVMRIINYGIDDGSYTLLSQTPYSDITINYELPLQNIKKNIFYNFEGQDIQAFGTQNFNYYAGMNLTLSATVTFDLTIANPSDTVAFNFSINGNVIAASPSLSTTCITNVSNCCLTRTNIDLKPGDLIQLGHLNVGSNSLTSSFSLSGGFLQTTSRWYSVTLSCNF